MQDRPSRMCYEAMIAIIEKHGIRSEEQYGQFFVQFDSFDGKTVRGASKQTQGVQSAISFVKQLARSSRSITEQFAFLFERILLELSIPNTEYGYWIKDTGSFISVGYEQHENVGIYSESNSWRTPLMLTFKQFLQEKVLDFPDSRQGTNFTCGAAAVQSVLRYYDEKDVEKENAISKDLKTTTTIGVQPKNIVKYFENRGYKVDHREMTIDDVKQYIDKNIPVIMLIQAWGNKQRYTNDYKDGHYVVAMGYQGTTMYFDDPSIHSNRGKLSFSEIKRRWHGQKTDPVNLGIAVYGKRPKYKSSEIITIK